jgi:hypothetical protein
MVSDSCSFSIRFGSGEPLSARLHHIVTGFLSWSKSLTHTSSIHMTSLLLFLSVLINIYFLRSRHYQTPTASKVSEPVVQATVARKDSKSVQTLVQAQKPSVILTASPSSTEKEFVDLSSKRDVETCHALVKNGRGKDLNDDELVGLIQVGKVAPYALEKILGPNERAVLLRRRLIGKLY